MVSKKVLSQYIDLQKELNEIREKIAKLEKEIAKINEEGPVADKVMGGEGGIQSFKIEGFPYPEYSKKKTLLLSRKNTLTKLEIKILEAKNDVEHFISTIDDSHIRRIISFRFIDGLSWNGVADRMGGGNTEGSVKMAFERFMQ